MSVLLCQGDALHLSLKDASVACCVTSPPYFALRRYDCGPGELGLEESPEAYIAAMVQVFREVKRVLHPMGTLWLNCGTTYQDGQDLGIPWRLAFALKEDGWRLRSEIIYAKLNPMPESVQTRPTRSHEQVFLFSKQARYHYDAEAVKESSTETSGWARQRGKGENTWEYNNTPERIAVTGQPIAASTFGTYGARACRSVWSLPSEPSGFQHYAAFPQALVRRCLLAGAPSAVCSQCGAPHRRVVETVGYQRMRWAPGVDQYHTQANGKHGATSSLSTGDVAHKATTGFAPTCLCQAGTAPSVVLDPFCGSATTLLVARDLGHHAVGVDLSWNYLSTIARVRLGLAKLDAWHGRTGHPAPAVVYDDLPLFGGAP
jgi:DNA modification methylase